MTHGVKELIRSLMPRTIRPRRIMAGPLLGAWLVTSWHDYPAGLSGRTERPLLDWFATHVRPGDTWLDVGAHYGYTTFALGRLVGAGGARVRVRAGDRQRWMRRSGPCVERAESSDGAPVRSGHGRESRGSPPADDPRHGRLDALTGYRHTIRYGPRRPIRLALAAGQPCRRQD